MEGVACPPGRLLCSRRPLPYRSATRWTTSAITSGKCRWALCDVRWKFSVYDCFARGVSRVRASCTVPRLQVRPLWLRIMRRSKQSKQSKQGILEQGLKTARKSVNHANRPPHPAFFMSSRSEVDISGERSRRTRTHRAPRRALTWMRRAGVPTTSASLALRKPSPMRSCPCPRCSTRRWPAARSRT